MAGQPADASLGRGKDLSRKAWVGEETKELVRYFFLESMQARDSCIRNSSRSACGREILPRHLAEQGEGPPLLFFA